MIVEQRAPRGFEREGSLYRPVERQRVLRSSYLPPREREQRAAPYGGPLGLDEFGVLGATSGQSTPFSALPGYLVDISADAVTQAGGTVSAFSDTSGHEHGFTCPSQPAYEETGWTNGTPSVLFNGSANYAVCATSLAQDLVGGTDKAFTIYLVAQQVTNPPANATIFGCGSTSSVNPIVRWNVAGSGNITYWRRDDAGSQLQSPGIAIGTTAHIITLAYSGTSYVARVDGSTVASGALDTGEITVNRATIGALVRDSVGGFVHMRFKRFLGYAADHGPSEYGAAEAALLAAHF